MHQRRHVGAIEIGYVIGHIEQSTLAGQIGYGSVDDRRLSHPNLVEVRGGNRIFSLKQTPTAVPSMLQCKIISWTATGLAPYIRGGPRPPDGAQRSGRGRYNATDDAPEGAALFVRAVRQTAGLDTRNAIGRGTWPLPSIKSRQVQTKIGHR